MISNTATVEKPILSSKFNYLPKLVTYYFFFVIIFCITEFILSVMNERNNFNDFVINDGEQIFLKIKIVKIGILFLIY